MKTLGLDLGTNSVGWSVVDPSLQKPLIAKGVQVFSKGVGEGKTGEFSLASERTGYRSARRIKQRRKWRKQATLGVLAKNGFCPGLTQDDIDQWRYEKKYPTSDEFKTWQRIWEKDEKGRPATPYYYRWLVASKTLDLSLEKNRYRLGRALYHLAQRRGYKSNRLSGDEKDGVVNKAIAEKKEARGGRTLGQYYYEECVGKTTVRGEGHYTGRSDYEEEFEQICRVQKLSPELMEELKNAIFFQRPLKSQKGTVGPCLLEPKKRRAPVSHPVYERFCAVQFVNNIRMRPQGESEYRNLTEEERETVLAWMATRSKVEKFEALARQITPKRSKRTFGEKRHHMDVQTWGFTYRKDAGVPASPTTARFIKLFGVNYADELKRRYVKAGAKSGDEVVTDIWHAIFSFPDHENLEEFARTQLGIDDEDDLELFTRPLNQGYGTISINAIRKILVWLEQGLIYSHAVFMANMPSLFKKNGMRWEEVAKDVVTKVGQILSTHRQDVAVERSVNSAIKRLREYDISDFEMHMVAGRNRREVEKDCEGSLRASVGGRTWNDFSEEKQTELISRVVTLLRERYVPKPAEASFKPVLSLQQRISEMLKEDYGLREEDVEKLYHPSATETYLKTKDELGSPRIPSIRNPVFMRTMYRLKAVLNELISQGVIDSETVVQVEMARDLNNANDRAAIERYQREREKQRKGYAAKIEELGFTASQTNILKYQLWVEQEERCLYTDMQISVTEFLGENPVYDIEHTVPQSRRFDNSQTNVTLCDRKYNRDVKRNRIPQELEKREEILDRARKVWEPKITLLEVKYAKDKAACKAAADKLSKDSARQRLLYDRMELKYWQNKLRSFEITEVPEGFMNSQLVDTRIITKYAVLYLKSYFERVYSMKASALSALRNIWGLNEKLRDQHVHHCIDATIVASVRPSFYRDLAEFYHKYERYEQGNGKHPHPPEPWSGFAAYLNDQLAKDVLVVHHHKDNLLKQTFEKIRKNGDVHLVQGDTVRGSLHKDTYYGKILRPPEKGDKGHGPLVCVVRRKLDGNFKDFDQIVDPVIRECVKNQKEKLKTGDTIWFDEERQVPIKKVRVKVSAKPDSVISIKSHRDSSRSLHKRSLFVVNDENYMVALYRDTNANGRSPAWRKISNLQAVEAWKNNTWQEILPEIDENGRRKISVLKKEMQIILCKTKDEDVKNLSKPELLLRLYRVKKLEGPRTIIRHHLEARAPKALPRCVSKFPWEKTDKPLGLLNLGTNLLNIKIEGQDFKISDTGEINWME
ncbi:HNH endonuclease domain-containing protein [Kiritimatiellaeota bacterium B1221]|nr:HNH endonuclease domain-containing protein [Kiritimatiellaeota bacterium B1221]